MQQAAGGSHFSPAKDLPLFIVWLSNYMSAFYFQLETIGFI